MKPELSAEYLAIVVGVFTCACVDMSGSETDAGESDTGDNECPVAIELPGDSVFPEGITASADGRLYVGSAATGEIFEIQPCTGDGAVVETFAAPGGEVVGAGGMRVSDDQTTLWVCSTDFSFTAPAAIVGFDREGGSVIAVHAWPDMGGICNDIAFDDSGNLYATDSFMARIMRVSADELMRDGAAEVWSQESAFETPMGQFGLNGIAWMPSGALLVDIFYASDADGSKLVRVPIAADGTAGAAQLVDHDAAILGGDAIVPAGDGAYLIIEAFAPALSRLTSSGDGLAVERLHTDLDTPTSVVPLGADAWVVESQLDHFFGQDPNPPTLPFRVVRRSL